MDAAGFASPTISSRTSSSVSLRKVGQIPSPPERRPRLPPANDADARRSRRPPRLRARTRTPPPRSPRADTTFAGLVTIAGDGFRAASAAAPCRAVRRSTAAPYRPATVSHPHPRASAKCRMNSGRSITHLRPRPDPSSPPPENRPVSPTQSTLKPSAPPPPAPVSAPANPAHRAAPRHTSPAPPSTFPRLANRSPHAFSGSAKCGAFSCAIDRSASASFKSPVLYSNKPRCR